MKILFFYIILHFAFIKCLICQDEVPDKSIKKKPDAKTLEMLKQLNADESDVLYKSNASNKFDSYLAEVGNKPSVEKNEFNLKTITLELMKAYSLIDKNVYKTLKSNKVDVKKISDLIEVKNISSSIFVVINNGDYLLKCGSLKVGGALSINIDNLECSINETIADENWGVSLFEWEKRPIKNLNLVKIHTCGTIGSIVYKMDQTGSLSICILSSVYNFDYKEKKYKSFGVSSFEPINDGDYFFNENGQLIGAGYSIKGKTTILDGLLISAIVSELTKTLGVKSNVGVLGQMVEKGFKISEVLNLESKLQVNDIIEEIDNIKISKVNIYSIKQSFKGKKKVDLKIFRDNKSENLKSIPTYHFSISNLKSRTNDEFKKIYLWIDPMDNQQITEAIKFIATCKELGIDKYEFKYYRLKEESLIDWLSTVKLMRFLNTNKKTEILEWFKGNPFQETEEYIAKLNKHFLLVKGSAEEVLNNKVEEEKILADYTDGMLKHHIVLLPAISFVNGKGVGFIQDFETWVQSLFDENGL